MSALVRGVDVSIFQAHVSWPALAAAGFKFGYARCLEGTTPDKTHDAHLVAIRTALGPGGSYQFGHPTMDVDACVDAFLARASLVQGQLRPVIDMETLARGADGKLHVPSNAAAWTDAWCERVKTALVRLFPDSFGARRGPLAYASTSYWEAMCGQRPGLGGALGWDWWNAAYESGVGVDNETDLDHPPHPAGLPYVAWQYAGNVALAGQVGLWDLDAAPDLERLKL